MPSRWMYENLLSASMITPSSAPAGWVGAVVPEQSGSATLYAQGGYTGDDDDLYIVEIDSINAGAEVGSATFRWKKGSSDSWEATGITTSSSPVTLDNGVQIKWTSGSGDDFAVADRWTFEAIRSYGRGKLLDGDRDSEWRSTGITSEFLLVNLGGAQNVQCCILADHNLTEAATVILKGNTADSWDSPAYSQAVNITGPHLVLFLDQTYRYWKLELADAGNTAAYLRASLFYLGTYFQPSKTFSFPWQRDTSWVGQKRTAAGNLRGMIVLGQAERHMVPYSACPAADVANFKTMMATVMSTSGHEASPVWFCPATSNPDDIIYGLLDPQLSRVPRMPTDTHSQLELVINEIPRTA